MKVNNDYDWYNKESALLVSSVAILLMLAHHFFGFSSYLSSGNKWNSVFIISGIESERIIAAFGKICVSIFAFNSGYVLWKLRDEYTNPKYLVNRLLPFYISYWLILILFWIYGLVIRDPIPQGKHLWLNIIGLDTDPNRTFVNVPFAWYVAYYTLFILLAPFLTKAFSKNIVLDALCFLFCMGISLLSGIPFAYPLIMSAVGIIVSKYNLFGKIALKIPKINIFLNLLLLCTLIIVRQALILFEFPLNPYIANGDIFIVPVFIFLIINILRYPPDSVALSYCSLAGAQ